jgi:hypothetical protein
MGHFDAMREGMYPITVKGVDRTVAEATASVAAGYAFPPLPAGNRWNSAFGGFVVECVKVLELRCEDATLLNVEVAERLHRNYFDALMDFRSAVNARDVHLIGVYHRLLLDSPDPALIRLTIPALRALDRKAVLTHEHVAACMQINRALSAWCDQNPDLFVDMWDIEDYLGKIRTKLSRLCFEELSPERVSMICMLVRRGIVEISQVRAALTDFNDITLSLMEGAL